MTGAQRVRALAMLRAGARPVEIARALGVNRRTLSRVLAASRKVDSSIPRPAAWPPFASGC